MKKISIIILLLALFFNISLFAFPMPKDNKVKFDIIRKNKVIGFHEINFTKNLENIIIETTIEIEVKILFIPAYKFFHNSTETWKDNNLIKFEGYTDFEDEREYFVEGIDKENLFMASGMDGKLELDEKILSSNFWNINILKEKEVFDTQKGIVRSIVVEDLGFEEITINKQKIKCQKFSLNASSNPKDKGPFPEYTLWYDENNELIMFKFRNWKDNKIITLVRNYKE